MVLAACQSYERRPLDAEAHRAAWQARTAALASRDALLEALGRQPTAAVRPGTLDVTDGLDLAEARLVALAFHPDLRLARLRARRAAAGAEDAGLWADPELSLDVLRITESVPDPWVVTPGLALSIPLSGRTDAERDLASAEQAAAHAAVLEAEWSVLHALEQAWIDWSATALRAEETRGLVESMDALVRTMESLAERGEVARPQATLFRLEQGLRRSRLLGLGGAAAAERLRLLGLLGLVPDAPVALVPAVAGLARILPDAADADATLEARNPRLARLRQEYEVSEQALRREVAKQWPDLTLGPLYEWDEGQSRIGFLGALPLPTLNTNRRGIAEAHADREVARAALEAAREELLGRWAAAHAAALTAQQAELERTVLPLAERQLVDATRLVELGEGEALTLLETLVRVHQTKLDLVDVRSAQARAQAELDFLIGPPPADEAPSAEERPR